MGLLQCILTIRYVFAHDLLLPAGESSENQPTIPPKGLILVTHEPSSVITAPGPHIRGRPLKAYSLGDREVDLLLPGTARSVFTI